MEDWFGPSANGQILNFEYVSRFISYSKNTGKFYRASRMGNVKAGEVKLKPDAHGYLKIQIRGKKIPLHRLAFLLTTGVWPNKDVDHINGVRTDNRWENLRLCSKSENNKNTGVRNDNKSGVTGVHWHKSVCKWVAYIKHEGRNIHLGSFDDKSKAIESRRNAESMYGFHANHGNRKAVKTIVRRTTPTAKRG